MSNEWYTPAKYIEAARSVMGSIDLDPASCELANQTVRAARYYTQEENGLMQPWYGNVWLNPPFGKSLYGKSNIGIFTRRLIDEYLDGRVKQAILLTTSRTDTIWFPALWDYPICFTSHKVEFDQKHPTKARFKGCHIHGTIFVYFGNNEVRFTEVFSKFGRIAKAIDTPKIRPRQLELVS